MELFASDWGRLLGILSLGLAGACLFPVVVFVTKTLFDLYRGAFMVTVERGLRDAVIFMDSQQVFLVTVAAAIGVGMIVYFLINWMVAVPAAVAVLFSPNWVLRKMKQRRADQVIRQLPDALGAMAASMRSGLNLTQAFQQVVKNQSDPISHELAQALGEYRMGKELTEALEDFYQRVPRQEIALLNSAVKISRASGGNLADTMDTLANTLREKEQVEGKIRALTSMGRMQGRVAMGFPVFIGYFIYRLEPDAMAKLFTTQLGWSFLTIMGAMMLFASFLMSKVVNIDV